MLWSTSCSPYKYTRRKKKHHNNKLEVLTKGADGAVDAKEEGREREKKRERERTKINLSCVVMETLRRRRSHLIVVFPDDVGGRFGRVVHHTSQVDVAAPVDEDVRTPEYGRFGLWGGREEAVVMGGKVARKRGKEREGDGERGKKSTVW